MKAVATTKLIVLLSVLLLVNQNSASAILLDGLLDKSKRSEFRRKVTNLRYGSKRVINLYGGTKNLIRLTNLPENAARVQMYISSNSKEHCNVIGKRNREVITEQQGSFVEFKILTSEHSNKDTANFKVFKKIEHEDREPTYRVIGTSSVDFTLTNCNDFEEDIQVCAKPVLVFQNEEGFFEELELSERTYKNSCKALADEARIMHDGPCNSSNGVE